MKYENFEQAQELVETINKYKEILEKIKLVTCDVERNYIKTKVQIVNFIEAAQQETVTSKFEITDTPCTFALDLLESYKEHCQHIIDLSMEQLEVL